MPNARTPNTAHEKEASPDTIGMGRRVNWGEKESSPRKIPNGGRPRSKKRSIRILKIFAND
jgi:hypothetical protein